MVQAVAPLKQEEAACFGYQTGLDYQVELAAELVHHSDRQQKKLAHLHFGGVAVLFVAAVGNAELAVVETVETAAAEHSIPWDSETSSVSSEAGTAAFEGVASVGFEGTCEAGEGSFEEELQH